MKVINDKVEGDLALEEYVKLNGMVTGTITVKDGGDLELCGMCCGSLVIENGGRAVISGMVIKEVINNGGEVSILGTVNGSVTKRGGTTMVDPKAVVRGQVL